MKILIRFCARLERKFLNTRRYQTERNIERNSEEQDILQSISFLVFGCGIFISFHLVARGRMDIFNQSFGDFSTRKWMTKNCCTMCIFPKLLKNVQIDVGRFENLCKTVYPVRWRIFLGLLIYTKRRYSFFTVVWKNVLVSRTIWQWGTIISEKWFWNNI